MIHSPSPKEPLVTIFTPAYNTAKYLRECIESVLQQTYSNWEYLIVNNCSTDNTLKIAQEYAAKEPRIRIHDNTQFLNQMQNWNHGLRQINYHSKYCKIVHGDDWLFPECIEKMVAVAEKNNRVGIVGSYRIDESEVNLVGLPPKEIFFSGREICRWYLLNGLYVFGSPSTLLIRTAVIKQEDPFYDEKNVHADTDLCLRVLSKWDFGFVHQVLSYTRRHNESSTSFANKFHTRTISRFKAFKTYGPYYLKPHEYQKREKYVVRSYHRFLAKRCFELRELDFWKYHRDELRKMGVSINWAKLMAAVLVQFTYPRETLRLLLDSFTNLQNCESVKAQRDDLKRVYTDE